MAASLPMKRRNRLFGTFALRYLLCMAHPAFHGSWLKVRRANEHIANLHEMFLTFSKSDFYTVSIEHDPEFRTNVLCFQMDTSRFPMEDAALTIGDALHNLKSALDHLYYQVVLSCGGVATKWIRFPFRDAADNLVAALNETLERKQITVPVFQLILETIKPYRGGNLVLWGLHELNIRDKHEILIPVLKLMMVDGVRLEDNEHHSVGKSSYIMDESCRIRLRDADYRTVVVKDKGYAGATILFDLGTPFQGDGVIKSLKQISEEVERTIGAFESLFLL